MRKTIAILGTVGVLLGAAYLYFLSPVGAYFHELKLEHDCPETNPDETCVRRWEAMGHVWSSFGLLARAQGWYRQAAEHGDIVAMFNLGWLYQKAAVQAAKDAGGGDEKATLSILEAYHDSAREWYRRAADKGFAPAMNNLGELYRAMGNPSDQAEAIRWLSAAARNGNPIAGWNMAVAYASGQGVAHDEAETRNWLTWDPTKSFDRRDLGWPTLERTTLFGAPLPGMEVVRLRASAKRQTPIELEMTPLKADPRIPTFQQRTEQLAHGNQ